VYGSNAIISIIIFLFILVVINWIFDRKTFRMDLTAAGQFSLSEQTIKILKNLKKDVKITAFFKSNEQRGMQDLLSEYTYFSKKIKVEFIDPDKKPGITKNYGVTQYNTTVIECGDKSEKITTVKENDLTNALIKVTREGKKVIYFTDGHGEKDIESGERDGYNQIRLKIEKENYDVKKVFIAQEGKFPDDCSVLVINGPQKPFFPGEIDSIDTYLNDGGRVLWLLDPDSPIDKDFFDRWGVEVTNTTVIDASGFGRFFGLSAAAPLVNRYPPHIITEDFRNVATFYPLARAIVPKENPGEDITVSKLCETSSNSWGETELKNNRAKYDEGKDLKGPLAIGVVVTKILERAYLPDQKDKTAQMVIFGDSDFASNLYYGNAGNGDLFLNTINWLAEEKDLISIRPRDPEDRRLNLSSRQTKFVFWFTLVIMPVIVILSGVSIYVNRRKG
ncbi:hypothetical protein DRQ09_01460, partial [candidate division KSB1 bacterium]